MKIIAVMPAYNEERNIADVIKKTKNYVDEVIVVDDGSVDDTIKEAKNADLVLEHMINMGKGLALKTGIEAAIKRRGNIIITIDSDNQHNPEDIPKMINIIKNEDMDIVIGSRSFNRNMPLSYKIGNIFLYNTFKFLFKVNIVDTQCGFRAFKSNIYKKIRWMASSYSVETEMLVKVGKNRLKYKELPIQTIYEDRYKGTTIFDGIKIFLNMLLWKIRE